MLPQLRFAFKAQLSLLSQISQRTKVINRIIIYPIQL